MWGFRGRVDFGEKFLRKEVTEVMNEFLQGSWLDEPGACGVKGFFPTATLVVDAIASTVARFTPKVDLSFAPTFRSILARPGLILCIDRDATAVDHSAKELLQSLTQVPSLFGAPGTPVTNAG
jgi:hypothetical protein